jgi:putative SOS response-associated peptidase YedK
MCGRYVIKNPVTKTSKLVKSAIQVEDNENYNAHPYQKLPVIKKYKNGNTLEALKWGLIPGWAKDKDFKALINARLETIDEKVSFKKLIKNNRCVAVADGFYEWKREEKRKNSTLFYKKRYEPNIFCRNL